ncbi:restriction endonuclease subunit S [Methanosarcina mazei]|jgi:type I restriction enzyme S subunit|uniref:Restriction endonuclease subunit S n=5 Tax=Methanosarcina mazei TaxID=2209 RepID=A0A0F8TRQ8_METMZ|nr:restriction endonuclease subunit S [Methanosarcina mazei]AAM30126.1 type I restriction-modification system specificity subunit [Methanosarcina mazei Go1]AKB39853.1 Type I restriction-modification system, specificity subunit S [Methanosarcina mazei WWM610]AKB60825.1 Type I restriction-modification system, specificity subunit S [Methanosarcina mazei SarPi]AKB64069.1 Type I restriction-modification system, specificity subunit S [Methanosarcina mazei S-6]KKG03864.1 restriction endonuclease subu
MFEKTIALNEFIILQRGFDLPASDRKNGNVPVVASTGIGGYHDEAKVEAPGVVIGRSGSIGGGQFITENFWPLNTTLWVKDFKGHHPRYVYYLLKSIDFKQFNVGSGVPTLNRNHLSSILVSDIGINYETKIAEILGKIDDKIELNLKINYTLEAMAQAIFKSWFVDFDPVKAKIAAIEAGEDSDGVTRAAISAISGKTDEELDQLQAEQPEHYIQLKNTAELFPSTMQESELGEIPDGWEVKSLYDFAQYINGAAFKSEDFSSNHEGLPIIKIRELKYGITPQTEFTKKEFDQKYRINNGEILFSWSGSPDTSIDIFLWTGGNGWLNQHTFRVIPQEAEEKEFIFFLLKFFKKSFIEIARNKQTTGLGHVTSKDLKNMFASFPTKNVIKLFNDVGEPIVSKIFFNSTENNNLSKIRDFLLPKLLSGELSVEAVEFAEE